MNRPEPMDLGQVAGPGPGGRIAAGAPAPTSSPLATAWECPRCYIVVWEADGMPRCRRCGFWDTAS